MKAPLDMTRVLFVETRSIATTPNPAVSGFGVHDVCLVEEEAQCWQLYNSRQK